MAKPFLPEKPSFEPAPREMFKGELRAEHELTKGELEDLKKKLNEKLRSERNKTDDPDFDDMIQKCIRTMETKGKDYTVGTNDRLHNFRTSAEFLGITMEQVWGNYFYKQVAAVFNYVKSGGQSESEPIEDRVMDCIVYLLLFTKIVKEMKMGSVPKDEKPKIGTIQKFIREGMVERHDLIGLGGTHAPSDDPEKMG
jgi:hypothetical protein